MHSVNACLKPEPSDDHWLKQMHLQQVRAEQDEQDSVLKVSPQYDQVRQVEMLRRRKESLKATNSTGGGPKVVKRSESKGEDDKEDGARKKIFYIE